LVAVGTLLPRANAAACPQLAKADFASSSQHVREGQRIAERKPRSRRCSVRPLRWARSQPQTFRRGFARSEDRCLEAFARRLRGTSAATPCPGVGYFRGAGQVGECPVHEKQPRQPAVGYAYRRGGQLPVVPQFEFLDLSRDRCSALSASFSYCFARRIILALPFLSVILRARVRASSTRLRQCFASSAALITSAGRFSPRGPLGICFSAPRWQIARGGW
jgi:hypothetical protein